MRHAQWIVVVTCAEFHPVENSCHLTHSQDVDVVWVIVDARKAGGVDCVRVVAVDAFNQMPRLKHDTFARNTEIALLKINDFM